MMPSSFVLAALTRLLVGAHPRWVGSAPSHAQRIYFANHSSHIDTVAIWTALPVALRRNTRPVAARDYWGKDALRRHIALRSLNAVLIDRQRQNPDDDPLAPLCDALQAGDSLILFPEGTRGSTRIPGPFKSGLFRLAQRFPAVELIPVYLDNLYRAMPKGRLLPVPFACSVRFGAPLPCCDDKERFLTQARDAVVALA